jgi:succinoglycan biosynthesis protein ExoL
MLSILNDARDSKRITMLQEAGFKVEAVAFDRGFRNGRQPNCPVKILCKIRDGHYFERIFKIASVFKNIRYNIRRNDIIYASGMDMAFAGVIAGWGLNKTVILEVGDIRKIQVSHGIIGYAERMLERYICWRCNLIVATASGFIDGYYRGKLRISTPSIVVENKLEASIPPYNPLGTIDVGLPLVDRALRIGYFGMLRCEWSWKVLETLAELAPEKVQIVVAGRVLSPHDLQSRAEKHSNIHFRGEFRSPDDLAELYGAVDLVWACYPGPNQGDADWQWAQAICRSNRYYESCFFQKPIISHAASADGAETANYDIGLVINDYDVSKTVRMIMNISPGDIERWIRNISQLPRSVYVMIDEPMKLAAAITSNATGFSSNS